MTNAPVPPVGIPSVGTVQPIPSNGGPRWLGLSVDGWSRLITGVGVPTVIVFVLLYFTGKYLPPVVDGHLNMLKQTTQMLQGVQETISVSNKLLAEVLEGQRKAEIIQEEATKEYRHTMTQSQFRQEQDSKSILETLKLLTETMQGIREGMSVK